jgi:MFS family permease
MLWPVPAICAASFVLGIAMEIMMVQWTVALARNIPPEKLARVSSYDAFGSVMAMPVGAVLAGPIAAWIGVSATQYGAAVLIVAASALALIPREIRKLRADELGGPALGRPVVSRPVVSKPVVSATAGPEPDSLPVPDPAAASAVRAAR